MRMEGIDRCLREQAMPVSCRRYVVLVSPLSHVPCGRAARLPTEDLPGLRTRLGPHGDCEATGASSGLARRCTSVPQRLRSQIPL